MLEFRSAADIIVTGVTFQNAPYWALHPYNCTRFSAVGVRQPPSLCLLQNYQAVFPLQGDAALQSCSDVGA